MYDSQHLKLTKSLKREDLNSTLDIYNHSCGAQVIRIKNKDPEKLF